jgi:elongator complex protein 6
MEANKRFGFVDGLIGLYLPAQKPLPGRGGQKVLSHPNLEAISGDIQQAIQQLNVQDDGSRVLLVVDQLDLLLATGGKQVGTVEVGEMLLGLREVCSLFTIPSSLI